MSANPLRKVLGIFILLFFLLTSAIAQTSKPASNSSIPGGGGSSSNIVGPDTIYYGSNVQYTTIGGCDVLWNVFDCNSNPIGSYDFTSAMGTGWIWTSEFYPQNCGSFTICTEVFQYPCGVGCKTITVLPIPLQPGSITSSNQTVLYNIIPSTISATQATGGICAGNYLYQWQYSYNGNVFDDIDSAITSNLNLNETLDSNTYFRRRVICGLDTAYTASQMVTVIKAFHAGKITTTTQAINSNTVPPLIEATEANYGSCSVYTYQWQQSTDGLTFSNISTGTLQNLISSTPLTTSTFFRRKAICGVDYGYTNVIAISIKQINTPPVIVKNSIDSILDDAQINIATLFNIYNDTIANNRNDIDTTLTKAFAQDVLQQKLTNLNNSYSTLEQADIDSLMIAPIEDSIAIRLSVSSSGGMGVDSLPSLGPFLDDNIIQLYRSIGNYSAIDSLINLEPIVPVEDVYATMIESSFNNTNLLASQQTLTVEQSPYPIISWTRSVVINGPTLVTRDQIVNYTGTFNFSLGSPSDIRWIVIGGTITSQNVNPANGTIYANVLWTSSFGLPYIALLDVNTGQYTSLLVRFTTPFLNCRVFPASQILYYGQTPAILNASNCYESTGNYSNFQWQVLDVYSNTNWTDIQGATATNYQPLPLSGAWLLYRRITKVYSNTMGLLGVYFSSAVSVKLKPLDPGTISALITSIQKNTAPVVDVKSPSGGYSPPASNYSYIWQYSEDNGASWTNIGTAATYPGFLLTKNSKVRRVVKISGVPASVYNLPVTFWEAPSNVIDFAVYYQTADYENKNYIRENVVLTRGIQTWENADALTIDKKIQTTTYLDGLSRPVQVVGKGTHYDETTGQWYDMVQSITYETGGRVDKSLLPYPSTENIGKFKNNSATDQPAYYQAKFGDNNAFAKVEYDGSPLDKVIKSYAPGNSWVGSNVNINGDAEPYNSTESVQWFTIGYNSTDLPVSQGAYTSLFLLKTFGKDEKQKKVVTYSNRMGQVVLKKVQLADDASLSLQHQGWLCTYYVYNDHGQLRYTITPKAVKELESNNWVFTQSIADELCFWYDYDELGRTVAKKTPGKGVEYVVYDSRNRPVFTQDANQRTKSPDEWLTVLYDELNRPVLTGIYKSDNTRDQMQTNASAQTSSISVTTINGGTVNLWGSPLTASIINTTTVFTQLTFNYYDNYTFSGAKAFNSAHTQNLVYKNTGSTGDIEQPVLSSRTYGMLTGSKILVLDGSATPKFLATTAFFDEEGRGIQIQADNIKTGVEITSLQYHFDGRILCKSETHNGTGTTYTNFNILTKYKFDKIGRVVGIGKKMNNTVRSYITSPNIFSAQEDDDAGYKITVKYNFNEIGRMVKKTLSPTGGTGGAPLETIDYTYNIRGWLTGINKDYAIAEYSGSQWTHFFGMYIGYDNADGKFNTAQKNGQITGVQWKSQGDNTPMKFDYAYDNANRLLAANFSQKGNSSEAWNNAKMNFSTNNVSYDENGNLLTMIQMGVLPGATSPVTMDNLVYSYTTKTNKLIRVDDNGNAGAMNGKQGDFKDGINTAGTPDYSYDNNGNIVLDNNKKIQSVTYNYLDKPEQITVGATANTNGGTIKYIYSASGFKIQKTVTENPSAANGNQQKIITTTYIGAFVYEAVILGGVAQPEQLQMIGHEEGRIRIITPYINASDPANYIGGGITLPGGKQGVFDYFITDNLGNVRAAITEEINKGSGICTMEDANATIKQYEESMFGNTINNEVVSTRIAKPVAWSSNTSAKVSRVLSPDGIQTKIGPNAFLRVMAGDLISTKVDYYYKKNPGSSGSASTGLNALLQTLLNVLTGGKATTIIKDQASAIQTNLNGTAPLQTLMNSQPNTGVGAAPRAYLNYVFFDEQFNFVSESSGFQRVSQAGNGAAPLIATNLKAPKNGYVFVYLSNGSTEPVYFDNFTVSHERGRLIEENHYYAHGLKIAAISSKSVSSSLNVKMTNYGYQGTFSEEVTEFELNYNEFALRTYDPQVGRWTTPDPYDEFASPYLGMGNDPANNVDPDGGSIAGIGSAIWSFFGGSASSATTSVLQQVACPGTSTLVSFSFSASSFISYFLLGVDGAVKGIFSRPPVKYKPDIRIGRGGPRVSPNGGLYKPYKIRPSIWRTGWRLLNTQLIRNPVTLTILLLTIPANGHQQYRNRETDDPGEFLSQEQEDSEEDNYEKDHPDQQIRYVTYTKTRLNEDGSTTVYSGRTSGPANMNATDIVAKRDLAHKLDPGKKGYGPALPDRDAVGSLKDQSAKWAIRGREQQLIDFNGRSRTDGGASGNHYRGVSKININGYTYHLKANSKWGELYKFTGIFK
jgi:RHS repeat-associated protein